jgi:hypothetical protein
MAAPATALAKELAEASHWDEQDLDILAFKLWQRASCPEDPVDDGWMSEEEALRCHASCL